MRKLIFLQSLILTALIIASPAFAQSADVARIQNFIKNIIQILVTLAGVTATGLFYHGSSSLTTRKMVLLLGKGLSG